MSGSAEASPHPVRVLISRDPHAAGLPLPKAMTSGAAGLDLCAAIADPLVLSPGSRMAVPTGLRVSIPNGFEAQVRPRSGLALRHGILLPNAPGTIDSDYRGEILVILMNAGEVAFEIERGDRIAQLVVAPVARPEWVEVEELDETDRGDGGFGHTGKR